MQPCGSGVCQLRIDFLDAVLATPNGDGVCNTDLLTITGGATTVPPLCGDNTGQHVYVDFDGTTPIQISVSATPGYTFARHWNIKVSQINCDSAWRGMWIRTWRRICAQIIIKSIDTVTASTVWLSAVLQRPIGRGA